MTTTTAKYVLTAAAAQYCTQRGRTISASFLRKLRLKGVNDPGTHGPKWVRDPTTNYVLYAIDELDRWVTDWEQQLAATRKPKHSRLDQVAA